MLNPRFSLPISVRALGATVAALGVVAVSATAASAHVEVEPSTTAAGAYTVLTFSVPHGCEGSATTRIAVQMPESIPQVTPTVNPNWTIRKVTESLAEPVTDAHGNKITDRVAQVVFTARTPLEDGYRDTLALSVQVPDEEGETLTFPVIQTCEKGSTAWNETPAAGQDEEELDHPAPSFTITAATEAGHHGEAAADEAAADSRPDSKAGSKAHVGKDDDSEDSEDSEDSGTTGLAIGGLVAGVAGLLLSGFALVRSGRKA